MILTNGFIGEKSFFIECKYPLERGNYPLSALLLHQATESFYSAILLVFTGYKPRLHDIEKLGSLASNYSDELLKIFPRDTKEQEEKFVLLKSAYTEARYNKNYKITEEQLLYLIKRIEKLSFKKIHSLAWWSCQIFFIQFNFFIFDFYRK